MIDLPRISFTAIVAFLSCNTSFDSTANWQIFQDIHLIFIGPILYSIYVFLCHLVKIDKGVTSRAINYQVLDFTILAKLNLVEDEQ